MGFVKKRHAARPTQCNTTPKPALIVENPPQLSSSKIAPTCILFPSPLYLYPGEPMEREPRRREENRQPEALPVHFTGLPEQLQAVPQWVVWKYANVDGEWKKLPFSPVTGKHASVRDASTWGSVQEAHHAYQSGEFSGVGIVLTADLGIVGVDLDHCIKNGETHPGAVRIISLLDSYTETSPSGKGIRILLEGKLPGVRRRRGSVELYEDLRYLTLTGQWREQTPQEIQSRHKALYGVYQKLFPGESHRQGKENTGGGYTQASRPDETVLQKALHARNGETFRRYYTGDSSLWEGAGAKHASQSEADFTLALMLLYWTNGDAAQVDRLFRQSGLMREKWGRPIRGAKTYGERLIQDAISKGNH
jgi:primase-polymerase (primpol)-like protein